MNTKTYYNDYRELGLTVVPVEWDTEAKAPKSHRNWSTDKPLPLSSKHNAIMIKTDGDVACLDFDIKNTNRKTIFDEFKAIVLNQHPEIYDKLYIEKTRNAGYHVWLKYPRLDKKLALAESETGNEVIALYAKGPLVYTFPTPGYSEYHSSMADISELSDYEFQYLISTSQIFNEYKPDYDPSLKAVNYPEGYENLLSQFDKKIPDEAWVYTLSRIGLHEITDYKYSKKDKFRAYRRKGSDSPGISAKVYFHTKRVMIFSASMHNFPNWHNKAEYPIWSLPPSFVLFYHNKRDWKATIEDINCIIESTGIDIDQPTIKTDFPLDVFPKEIKDSIIEVCHHRSLDPGFVATAGLWTISSLAGTRYHSDFKSEGKNILFCLMIAPVSVGKTPAYKVMCENPLKESHEAMDIKYMQQLQQWSEDKAEAMKEKQSFTDKRPTRFIPVSADGTTEGYIHKSMSQPNGIGIYQDEAETILNAGNFKATNDAISFFTQAFSGGRITQVRADETKERVVPNLNLNLLMGTQPARVKNIFTEDRLSSGFASRFLMVQADYSELNTDSDPFGMKKEMCSEWRDIVTGLFFGGMDYNAGADQIFIRMTDGAKQRYRQYYKQLLTEANTRIKSKAEEYIIGTEAKMSAYLPRLIQILSIIYDHTGPIITEDIVDKGYRLYRYYAESTIRIIAELNGELETGLPGDLELLYQTLPDEFTRAEAAAACIRINLKERRFDNSIRRKDFSRLFQKIGQGKYRKV